jgi:hypothetical protein
MHHDSPRLTIVFSSAAAFCDAEELSVSIVVVIHGACNGNFNM